MSKPRLLDLFCKAGGATAGYQRAGFYVAGVDVEHQPHYCGDEFVQADALEALEYSGGMWSDFDAIHASPPCQANVRGLGGSSETPSAACPCGIGETSRRSIPHDSTVATPTEGDDPEEPEGDDRSGEGR